MDKICLVYQCSGGGDILFLQKLARHYLDLGFRVIWPVVEEYANFKDYIPEIEWISWEDKNNKLTHKDPLPDHIQFPKKEFYKPGTGSILADDFVFFDGFFSPGNQPVMDFKYNSINMPFDDWADYVIFNRNTEKEDCLFYDLLGLRDQEEYVFINRNYQMRPQVLSYNRISNNPNDYGKKVVEMQIFDGFSIFDWYKVICMASSIHMIETSLNYMMEGPQMRDNLTSDLNLYSRHNWFGEVQHLFKLPWKYHR